MATAVLGQARRQGNSGAGKLADDQHEQVHFGTSRLSSYNPASGNSTALKPRLAKQRMRAEWATVFAAKVLGLKKSSGSLVGRLTAVLAMGATGKRGARASVTAADQHSGLAPVLPPPHPHFPPANPLFTKTLQIFEVA